MREPTKRVPLEAVTHQEITVVGDRRVVRQIGWVDLNSVEQALVSTIVDARYAEAARLTGDGRDNTYDPTTVKGFLMSAEKQHDSSIGLTLINRYVRTALRY